MLPLSVLHAGNLEALHKHTGVYRTRETHSEGDTVHSHPVSPSQHMNISGASI